MLHFEITDDPRRSSQQLKNTNKNLSGHEMKKQLGGRRIDIPVKNFSRSTILEAGELTRILKSMLLGLDGF